MELYDELMPNEPRLMPMQSHPFNGDVYVCEQFLELQTHFKIKTVIELGSCVMGTTKWLAENFDNVKTVEINDTFRNIGLQRIKGLRNVESYLGDSGKMLPAMLSGCNNDVLIWIDSHWEKHFPLFDELQVIKQSQLMPIIVIHDCKVPYQPELGYDSYNGIDISFETIKPFLDDIYGGEGEYQYHYNSYEASTGAKTGLIYIYGSNHSL